MWWAHTCIPGYEPTLRFVRLYILSINHKSPPPQSVRAIDSLPNYHVRPL